MNMETIVQNEVSVAGKVLVTNPKTFSEGFDLSR